MWLETHINDTADVIFEATNTQGHALCMEQDVGISLFVCFLLRCKLDIVFNVHLVHGHHHKKMNIEHRFSFAN